MGRSCVSSALNLLPNDWITKYLLGWATFVFFFLSVRPLIQCFLVEFFRVCSAFSALVIVVCVLLEPGASFLLHFLSLVGRSFVQRWFLLLASFGILHATYTCTGKCQRLRRAFEFFWNESYYPENFYLLSSNTNKWSYEFDMDDKVFIKVWGRFMWLRKIVQLNRVKTWTFLFSTKSDY